MKHKNEAGLIQRNIKMSWRNLAAYPNTDKLTKLVAGYIHKSTKYAVHESTLRHLDSLAIADTVSALDVGAIKQRHEILFLETEGEDGPYTLLSVKSTRFLRDCRSAGVTDDRCLRVLEDTRDENLVVFSIPQQGLEHLALPPGYMHVLMPLKTSEETTWTRSLSLTTQFLPMGELGEQVVASYSTVNGWTAEQSREHLHRTLRSLADTLPLLWACLDLGVEMELADPLPLALASPSEIVMYGYETFTWR